jgi:hypothetical protein
MWASILRDFVGFAIINLYAEMSWHARFLSRKLGDVMRL